MANPILRYLIILLNLHSILSTLATETDDLQKKFTSKCGDLCSNQNENGTKKDPGETECLRGCQYFNIEFLLNARNKDKTVDLNQLVERCGFSCSEAYGIDKINKENCFRGCNEMMTLQAKAPFINGWLVYMGATDRNMVLLQPDSDIPKEDWVLLDSIFRANDYDYDGVQYTNYDKILKADSHGQIDSVSRIGDNNHEQRFTISYCIPLWMWILPVLMLVAFIWMHYSNYIYGAFINNSLQHEFGIIDSNHLNGVPAVAGNKKLLRTNNEFIVGSDFYFYPAPAVPPPKYNDIAEAILMNDSDDEDASDSKLPTKTPNNGRPSTSMI